VSLKVSTAGIKLTPDAAIDLQLHTHYSDGLWMPEALIDHLVQEHFDLAAITDHDRADTAATLQVLAAAKGLPLLVAVEMTTTWNGEMTDVLCYGFDPEDNPLDALAQDVARRQRENTQAIFDYLHQHGYTFPQGEDEADERAAILDKPSAQQPNEMVAWLTRHGYGTGDQSVGKILMGAGFAFATSEIAAVVDAAHRGGAVCLVAHPGRGDGFPCFDAALLDQLRRDVPIDGLEAYYPLHTPEQTALYLDYARQHGLLTSSGSDSHSPDIPPIKYHVQQSRSLLERLGIEVK